MNTEFGPEYFNELLNLLPKRCRPCPFAQDLIASLVVYEDRRDELNLTILDIHDNCSGYSGELIDSEPEVDISGDDIQFSIGPVVNVNGCPYKVLIEQG